MGEYKGHLALGEALHIVEHGLNTDPVMVRVLHDKGGGAWDACYDVTLAGIDENHVSVLLPDPENLHSIMVVG